MAKIYDLADITGGVSRAADTANNHTSDGPVAWRLSWSYWLGYATKTRKSKPEHLDFTSREGAEAAKAHLIRRYTAVVACISPVHVAATIRERGYAAKQEKIPGAASWPPQARTTGGGS
jgi:hypothetical protein